MERKIPDPIWQKVVPQDVRYQRDEVLVAGYTLTDYLPENVEDCTPIIQQLLDRLAANGGGALYVPAGEYTCCGPIKVPTGVTLLGDWEKPDGQNPIGGTVLVYRGPALSDAFKTPFISLSQSSEVRGLAVWYPAQSERDPVAYPPTVRTSFWATAKEITLLNAWIGVEQIDGDSPTMHDIYGTALHIGIRDAMVTDIMRIEETRFSPDYWLNSGKFTGDEEALRTYLRTKATGVLLKRTDWSYYTDSSVDGYYIGLFCDDGGCYGQNYNLTFENCHYAIYAPFTHGNGQEITHTCIKNCDYGLYVPENGIFTAFTFQDVVIDAKEEAIGLHWPCKVTLVDSTVTGGTIQADNGMLIVMNSTFNTTDTVKVSLSGKAALLLVGNAGLSEANIQKDGEECTYSFDEKMVPNVVTFRLDDKQAKAAKTKVKRVCGDAFYSADVLAVALGLSLDATGQTDASATLNACLQKVGETGGTLYLPSGHYRIAEATVKIPSGVELRGAAGFSQVPCNTATVLDITVEGHAVELAARGGLRGVTLCYPEQTAAFLRENGKPRAYDYAVYAKDAPDVYVINVASFNTYNGVCLDGCDRHYVDGVAGLFMNRGVVVKNAVDGIVRDCQFNLQPIMRGYGWADDLLFREVAQIFFEHLQHDGYAFVLDNVNDEMVFGCFTYGSAKALLVTGDDTTATTIGFSGDYVTEAIDVHGGCLINMLNTQMTPFVYTNYTLTAVEDICAVRLRNTFKGVLNMANVEPWTQPQVIFQVEGGRLHVTNVNSGCGMTMDNTHVDRVELSKVRGDGCLHITGFLQYSPTVFVEDASVADAGFCGSAQLIDAPHMMRSIERFGE